MNDNEISYVSELLEAHLAGYNSVHLPGIGSLKCTLVNSSLNHMTGALKPPHYVIEYYSDSDDISMISLISNIAQISEQNAESIYNRWCEYITHTTNTTATYRIDKVGVLTVNTMSGSALFSPDKELASFLNPFGDDAEQRMITPTERVETPTESIEIPRESIEIPTESIEIPQKITTERKRNQAMTIFVCLVIFVAAIVGYMFYDLLTPRAQFLQAVDMEDMAIVPVVVDTDTTQNDSVSFVKDSIGLVKDSVAVLKDSVTTIEESDKTLPKTTEVKVEKVEKSEPKAEMQPVSDKGYHIIISTFSSEERALKHLEDLKREGENPLMFKTNNNKTPYYVSLGVFETKEAARAKMNTIKREELWIYLNK